MEIPEEWEYPSSGDEYDNSFAMLQAKGYCIPNKDNYHNPL